MGWLTYKKYQSKSKIRFHTNEAGRSFIPVIKSSLENGNVLVSVAEKGYANLFLCAKCRNVAACVRSQRKIGDAIFAERPSLMY
jgi:primosomal protein N'